MCKKKFVDLEELDKIFDNIQRAESFGWFLISRRLGRVGPFF